MLRLFLFGLLFFLGFVAGFLSIAMLVGWRLAADGYQGPVSDHFNGTHFVNAVPVAQPNPWKGIRYWWTAQPGPWREWTENPVYPPPPKRVGPGQMQATFINHATVLLQMDGLNILTDPIWSDRCSPLSWVGPMRRRAPGLTLEALPPIDVILISHNHYDHTDLPTLRRLVRDHSPRIYTGLGNGSYLTEQGISNVEELDWNQSRPLTPEIQLHALSCRHFSGRGLGDRNKTLWLSFALRGPSGAAYFGGDTGYSPHFAEAGRNHGPFRLAILPIGAYNPRWFMEPVHISPTEAVQAHKDLQASTSMSIHFGTFRLSEEGQDQPANDLQAALQKAGISPSQFWVLGFGESRPIP